MKKILIGMSVLLLLSACASKEPVKDVPVTDTKKPDTTTATPKTDTSTRTDTVKSDPVSGNPLKDPGNILSKREVFFDYDKDVVRDEFRSLLQAHAKYLVDNKNRRIRLEGHADERGSREYNMALGQRRADAVRRVLSVLGVTDTRIEMISFGEDKPKSNGHDEGSWAQNRRAEIVYDGE